MEVKCKKPIADYGGNILFHPKKSYKVLMENEKQVMLKDELGGLRWIPINEKFFKEHFEQVKETK